MDYLGDNGSGFGSGCGSGYIECAGYAFGTGYGAYRNGFGDNDPGSADNTGFGDGYFHGFSGLDNASGYG